MDTYQSRQRLAKWLTAAVAVVVASGWMIGLVAGIGARKLESEGGSGDSEESSIRSLMTKAIVDIRSSAGVLRRQWDEGMNQIMKTGNPNGE